MTNDDFRKLALSLPEAVEPSHFDHPDFRVGEKIIATLVGDRYSLQIARGPDGRGRAARAVRVPAD